MQACFDIRSHEKFAILRVMKRSSGFTVIELVIVAAFLAFAAVLFFIQKNDLQVAARDTERKTAINAIYYDLEEVYYAQHKYYPETITKDTLTAIDPALLTDPNGVAIGTSGSDYRYDATDCTDNHCQSYTLRSHLENEADYIKTSRH